MNDVDDIGRQHADIVRRSLSAVDPPPVESITKHRRPEASRFRTTLVTVIGVIAVALIGIALLLADDPSRMTATPPSTGALDSTPTSTVGESPGTITNTSIAVPEFDIGAFLDAKLGGAFGEIDDEIGVVVLAPAASEQAIATRLESALLPELQGVSFLHAPDVAAAAAEFADARGTRPIEGSWLAVGLVPEFSDSPIDRWTTDLAGVSGALVAVVDFEPGAVAVPDGWREVGRLPFGVGWEDPVLGTRAGVVVVSGATTLLVQSDGSWVAGPPAPIGRASECCGSVVLIPAGDSVVLMEAGTRSAWILDPATMKWRETGAPPETGFPASRHPLGSAYVHGDLFVVTAAARIRSGAGVANVAALDLGTGEWRTIEPVPTPIAVGGVTAVGDRLLVAGTAQDESNLLVGSRNPLVHEYTPDAGWRDVPSIPINGRASTITQIDGVGLLAWNYELESAILDSSGEWRQLEDVPMPEAECYPHSIAVDSGVVAECGGLAWFDTSTLGWRPISAGYTQRNAIVPDHIIGFAAVARDETSIRVLDLPPRDQG